jgi:hypothetical protein
MQSFGRPLQSYGTFVNSDTRDGSEKSYIEGDIALPAFEKSYVNAKTKSFLSNTLLGYERARHSIYLPSFGFHKADIAAQNFEDSFD